MNFPTKHDNNSRNESQISFMENKKVSDNYDSICVGWIQSHKIPTTEESDVCTDVYMIFWKKCKFEKLIKSF